MTVCIVLCLGLALGIAFLREFLDDTVRTPRDVARVGQMNLLGIIADEGDDPQAADAKLPIFDAPHSLTAEQFRQVRTRLSHATALDTTRSIMVTGPSPMDGKVTVVRAHSESRGLLLRMRDTLRQVKAEHIGVVLNAVRARGGGYYRRNIKTFYQYQNGD